VNRNRLGVAVLTMVVVACGTGAPTQTAVVTTTAPATASPAASAVATASAPPSTPAAATATAAAATATPVAGPVVVQLADSEYGQILVDAEGMTLYGQVLEGASGAPSCKDACLDSWPPLVVSGDYAVGEGLDPAIFTTVARDFGTQLKAGNYSLYRFVGDAAPGDTSGHGAAQGFWAVIGPDGELIAR